MNTITETAASIVITDRCKKCQHPFTLAFPPFSMKPEFSVVWTCACGMKNTASTSGIRDAEKGATARYSVVLVEPKERLTWIGETGQPLAK